MFTWVTYCFYFHQDFNLYEKFEFYTTLPICFYFQVTGVIAYFAAKNIPGSLRKSNLLNFVDMIQEVDEDSESSSNTSSINVAEQKDNIYHNRNDQCEEEIYSFLDQSFEKNNRDVSIITEKKV